MENEVETIGTESDCEIQFPSSNAMKNGELVISSEQNCPSSNSIMIVEPPPAYSMTEDVEMKDDDQSQHSESSTSVLKHMVRFNIVYPEIKCINLRRLYTEYLDENGLVDKASKPKEVDPETMAQNALEAVENTSIDHEFIPDLQLPTRKSCGVADTIKRLVSRMEIEGRIGSRSDFARSEKTRTNLEKEKEDLYDLDDDFIDDGDDWDPADLNLKANTIDQVWDEFEEESASGIIPKEFEYVLPEEIYQLKQLSPAPSSKAMIDKDIIEKLNKLEHAFVERNDNLINSHMLDIARKLFISKSPTDEKWKKSKSIVYKQLQIIFTIESEDKVREYVDLFYKKVKEKENIKAGFDSIKKLIKNLGIEVQNKGKLCADDVVRMILGNSNVESKIVAIGSSIREYFIQSKKIKTFNFIDEGQKDQPIEIKDLYEKDVYQIDPSMIKKIEQRLCEVSKNFEQGSPIYHLCNELDSKTINILNEDHIQEYFEKPMALLLYSREDRGKEQSSGKKSKGKNN